MQGRQFVGEGAAGRVEKAVLPVCKQGRPFVFQAQAYGTITRETRMHVQTSNSDSGTCLSYRPSITGMS